MARVQAVELWDGRAWPGRMTEGLPTFGFWSAPAGLATRRQLRAVGLRPSERWPTAQIVWHRGRRWAALYRIDLAKPVRPVTPAKRAALAAAMCARRTCGECGQIKSYCVPTSTRECWECFASKENNAHEMEHAA